MDFSKISEELPTIYYFLSVISTVWIQGKSDWLGKYQSKHPKPLLKNLNELSEFHAFAPFQEM